MRTAKRRVKTKTPVAPSGTRGRNGDVPKHSAKPLDHFELVNLRPINDKWGIVHIRCIGGVHLRNISVTISDDGNARLKFPRIISRSGADFGVAFALPPGQRALAEKAVAELWRRVAAAEPPKPPQVASAQEGGISCAVSAGESGSLDLPRKCQGKSRAADSPAQGNISPSVIERKAINA